jgi:hypothetical protein
VVAVALSAVVIAINTFFVVHSVIYDIPHQWEVWVAVAVFTAFYLIMCTYFILHMIVSMGNTRLGEYQVSKRYHTHYHYHYHHHCQLLLFYVIV